MIELVGEIGINANGDMLIAKKLIDVCAAAGVNYVKFQKRSIEIVYSEKELGSPRQSPWGTTTREQKAGLEFSYQDYQLIDAYCKGKGIGWFASPWDIKSASLISLAGTQFIKIASPMLTDLDFIQFCADQYRDKSFILSTGMSTAGDIANAVDIIGSKRIHAILHCTSTYPTSENEINLNYIRTLKEKYSWLRIGFSNHYPGIPFLVGAAALGAEMLEFHITLDRNSYGSDQASSLEPHAIFKLVKYVRGIEKGLGDGWKRVYDSELPIIAKLRS